MESLDTMRAMLSMSSAWRTKREMRHASTLSSSGWEKRLSALDITAMLRSVPVTCTASWAVSSPPVVLRCAEDGLHTHYTQERVKSQEGGTRKPGGAYPTKEKRVRVRYQI